MRDFSVYDIFQRNARLYKQNTGLVFDDERLTFDRLLNKVDNLAAGLAEQGISKGDRLAVLAHNDYRFFLLFGAASALGAILVPVNWRLSDEEIQYILNDSKPKILVADNNHKSRAKELTKQIESEIKIFDFNSSDSLSIDNLAGSKILEPATLSADDPFCLIYTAAVDGNPRGAVLTHGNIVFGNLQTAATMMLTKKDAYLNMLPLFHITGLNLALAIMHVGGKNVVIEKFDEKLSLQQTEKEQISVWGSFPPMLSRLLAEIEADNYDIACLRHVLGIDGPDNIKPFEEKTNSTFWILYGQTETSGLVSFSPALEKPGTAGTQGLLTKVKLVDDNENEVACGETGEIVVQGPLVFKGFWNQEKITEHTFRGNWHHTGDIGMMDDEGYLWFKGRKPEKELIKPGGENVYPVEVEAVIKEHPSIEDVSVIGVPDPKFGEGIKAVCVLKQDCSMTAQELMEFVASKIARYKKPRYVDFVNELPKKADGSIDRDKVKQVYG